MRAGKFIRFDRRRERLRLTAPARDRRNDFRADGAAGRLRDSRHGHRAAPLDVRSSDHVRVNSGLEACISRDLLRRPRSHARPRDPRACGGDGRREGNLRGHHGESRCARNPGRAYECGWRGVSRYMWPLAKLLASAWLPIDAPSFQPIMR
jgi:hypothetical protein